MTQLTTEFKMTGKMLKPGAMGKLVRSVAQETIREIMERGEQKLDQLLSPRPRGVYLSVGQAGRGKASTGNYRRHVHGRINGPIAVISDGGVIYGPWLEGISTRNQATRFPGYHAFRTTEQFLRKEQPKVGKKVLGKAVRRANS